MIEGPARTTVVFEAGDVATEIWPLLNAAARTKRIFKVRIYLHLEWIIKYRKYSDDFGIRIIQNQIKLVFRLVFGNKPILYVWEWDIRPSQRPVLSMLVASPLPFNWTNKINYTIFNDLKCCVSVKTDHIEVIIKNGKKARTLQTLTSVWKKRSLGLR